MGVSVRLVRSPVVIMCSLPAPEVMRMKELKAELDERKVAWRGTCFEKEELVAKLREARDMEMSGSQVSDDIKAAEASPDVKSPQAPKVESEPYDAAYSKAFEEAMTLTTKDLRARLAERNLGWADLFEKEELAARLASALARVALFSVSGKLSPGMACEVSADELRLEIEDRRNPLIVDVFATWCMLSSL